MEKRPPFSFLTMFKDGFKGMTLGRTLWIIVIVKLCIMFFVLKPFFFPNFLNSKAESKEEKADYVRQELIDRTTEADLKSEGIQ